MCTRATHTPPLPLPPLPRRPGARPGGMADDGVLQPVDPTATGEAEVTRAVRDALQKRKRDEDVDGDGDGAAPAAKAAAARAAAATAAAAALPPQAKTCVHEVALPAGFAGDREALLAPRYGGPRAKEYPFTLDPFQETAVACLVRSVRLMLARPLRWRVVTHAGCCAPQERRESVLVAAHTSAGKTVVAECARRAMPRARRSRQRALASDTRCQRVRVAVCVR
jgi:hypothetical protein